MTIIDGGCARFARNIHCKIFIILAYSQYRRYKYSSCTPPGCYEICCYLFSEGTLMRPPVIAEISPPGNTYKYGCCVCLYNIRGNTYKYGCCVCLYNIRGNTHKYELLCMPLQHLREYAQVQTAVYDFYSIFLGHSRCA